MDHIKKNVIAYLFLAFLFGAYSGHRKFENIQNGIQYASMGAGWLFEKAGDWSKDAAKTAKRRGR